MQSGAYATGAVNFKVWERELAEGKIDTSKVSVIWETPTYPDYHWTVRGDLDERFGEGFSQRVTETLLSIDDPALLQAFPREKFYPGLQCGLCPHRGHRQRHRPVGLTATGKFRRVPLPAGPVGAW